MSRIALFFLAFMAFVSCSEAQHGETAGAVINKKVSPAEFKEMLGDDIQLIDVRTADEYIGGKIANAQNIDFFASDFKDQISKLDKSKKTLVYCAVGGRSGKAAQIMKDLGFKEVYDLQGGYGGWPYK